jgi:curli biogenesis system outer membrane secretion channel CsgG
MSRRTLRTAAALAAVLGVAAGSTATSQAAPMRSTFSPHPIVQRTVVSALKVDAGATGDGPASDADCQDYAQDINDALDIAQNELNTGGMTDRWSQFTDLAKSVQDLAEDEGCFIVNPM